VAICSAPSPVIMGHIIKLELRCWASARASISCGSSEATMFWIRAMTSRENGPTCRYTASSATTQRIESGLLDMHWLNVDGRFRVVREGWS